MDWSTLGLGVIIGTFLGVLFGIVIGAILSAAGEDAARYDS